MKRRLRNHGNVIARLARPPSDDGATAQLYRHWVGAGTIRVATYWAPHCMIPRGSQQRLRGQEFHAMVSATLRAIITDAARRSDSLTP